MYLFFGAFGRSLCACKLLVDLASSVLYCTCYYDARVCIVMQGLTPTVTCVYIQEMGTLEVSGYVRGRPLSVNGLLHIPGLGDFQISKVGVCVCVCVVFHVVGWCGKWV